MSFLFEINFILLLLYQYIKGDWGIDSGAPKNWDAAQPNGLLTYDQNICTYVLVMKGLKESFDYKWKVFNF